MCGIAGFIGLARPNFDLNKTIRSMTDSLSHRGPDGAGYEIIPFDRKLDDSYIALGHRRLKIIDLSEKARQPMFNPTRTLAIVYNGEIYNYIELKNELVSKGYSFASNSDTEVVINAYAEWGTNCFNKFNGMWAIAIYDNLRHKLVLSRDRFGKKPLFFYKNNEEVIFASEIKSLLKHPSVIKRPNYEKVYRYIAMNYRYLDIDETSFFDNIFQIPKSSYVEIDKSLNMNTSKYWELSATSALSVIKDGEAVERFKDIFVNAVRLRLRSDVPVGCMLSGGMDSTSVTSVAYKILKNPITTFSGITGEELGVYDESEYIKAVVRETNARSHFIKPDPSDIFDTVDEMLYYHDEPICTVTWYSLYLIAKKIGLEKVPVILNGLAGDELLAGYWDHYHYNFYDLFEHGDVDALCYEIEMWKKNHGRKTEEIKQTIQFITSMKKHRGLESTKFSNYSYLMDNELQNKYAHNIILFSKLSGELPRRLSIELLQDGVPTVLRPEDRNTMSQSIESRSPFLDYQLVEFCFALPNKFKIRDGLGKWILREAMIGILPEEVRTRKDKAGFIAPADEWFRTINKEQICEMFNSDSFHRCGVFNVARVKEMYSEHLSRQKNHQMVLWQIINLDLWFRKFFYE